MKENVDNFLFGRYIIRNYTMADTKMYLDTFIFSITEQKIPLADKLSLSNRTASSGLRENVKPCKFTWLNIFP